jgi:hypothetical protein
MSMEKKYQKEGNGPQAIKTLDSLHDNAQL